MTERVRRRNSKWDLKEDSQHFPVGIRENNAWTGRSGESFQDEVSKTEWHSSKANENVKSDYNDASPPMKTWDADESYNMSMSPGLEGWRERNHSRSPRSGSTRLHRSRSRSPLHGFRREFEGQNDRSRSGSGASTPSCKDFAAGRCRRGGHCRFLHNDNRNYEERRYSANARGENWRSRNEKLESFGHANSEEQARYSQDKVSGLHEDHHEGNWEKHEGIRNISAERCNNFLKGRCFRGSSCKYAHDADIADEQGARERTHYKRDRNASFGHDYRREPDRTNSIPCKYFAAGNCHHGVSCRFSHESRERRPSQDERWSQKMDDEKRSRHSPKWTDNAAADSIHENVERRSGDDILGHGVGKQDSLWGGRKWGDETVVSDANSMQQRNGSNGGKLSDDADRRLWEGSKWIDEVAGSDIMKPSKWRIDSDDERVGNKAENTSRVGRKWSQEAAESELRKSPQWMNSNNDRKIGGPVSESTRSSHDPRVILLAGQNTTWGGSKWGDKPADQDFKKSSQFLSDNSGAGFSGLELKDHPKLIQVANKPSAGPNGEQYLHFINNEGSAPTNHNSGSQSLTHMNLLSQEKNQVLGQQLLASAVNMQRTIPEAAPVQQTSSHPSGDAASLPYKSSNVVTAILKPPSEISVVADTLPVPAMVSFHGQSFNSNSHNDVPQSISNFIMNAPRGPGFDLNEKVDQISQPYSSPHDQNSLPGQTLKIKDMIDLKNSEAASRALMTQNVVTSEQVAQITNLSASLAQIFGNGPQLPQLYATLNSIPSGLMPSHPNSVGSVVPAVASFPQSNQVVVPSKEYDPIGDSIEVSKSDANVQPSELVFDSIEQSKIADQEASTLLKSTGPSCITGAINGGDSSNNGSMEATLNNQNQEIKQVEPAIKERVDEPIDKGQDTAQLDDMDADGQNDEEGKKKKDAKGMRLFKFSLVETVKEILKPKWKEGQMSKEAHKTIVKKVVDKVTSTFQGAHVPQTQEKIDHYLSSSKPKLTKLVHAYVEKYLKT